MKRELIIIKSVKQAKKLEIISVVLTLFMAVFYNLMPLIVTVKIKKAGIVNNKQFFENDDIMRSWSIYLIINLVIELIITVALCIITVQAIMTIKRFFKEQCFK